MTGVLVVAETRRGELRDVSLELITAGRQITQAAGGRLAVAVMARRPEAYAGRLSAAGVDELLTVAMPSEHFEAHTAAHALEALMATEQADVVLLGHTADGMGLGPAVAARSGLGFASDVMRLGWSDGLVVTRGAYGGKLELELEFPPDACTLLLLRAGVFDRAEPGGEVSVRPVEVEFDQSARATEHIRFRTGDVGAVDVAEAPFLLSLGRGALADGSVRQFQQLAERLDATLTGSRPLIDAGWISSARGIGQSGRTVRPKVYLALGISGAAQHVAGIREAGTIIAVNHDAQAPIFDVADYGAVADLFEIVEQLEQHFAGRPVV